MSVSWRALALVFLSSTAAFVLGVTTQRLLLLQRTEKTDEPKLSKRAQRKEKRRKKDEAEKNGDRTALGSVESDLARMEKKRRKALERSQSRKDCALDELVKNASDSLGLSTALGDNSYEQLLVLPREVYLEHACLPTHAKCKGKLLSLGRVREVLKQQQGSASSKILFVSHRWTEDDLADTQQGATHSIVSEFLTEHEEFGFVWIDTASVASLAGGKGAEGGQVTQSISELHCPMLALLRADALLLVPQNGAAGPSSDGGYEDLEGCLARAWPALEFSLSQLGGDCPVHVRLHGKIRTMDPGMAFQDFVRGVVEEVGLAEAGGEDALRSNNWLTARDPMQVMAVARDEVMSVGSAEETQRLLRTMLEAAFPGTIAAMRKAARPRDGALAAYLLLSAVSWTNLKPKLTYTDNVECPKEMTYQTVAVVRSPYKERFGTPRQPFVTAGVLQGRELEGQVLFHKGQGFEEALEDLEGFEYVWLVTHMHLNKGWSRKVRPPRLPERKVGLFATRSPHRPNPLALSAVRITSVDARQGIINVSGLDLLDGTPVLDVKPYVPYCDSFSTAKCGWLDELVSNGSCEGGGEAPLHHHHQQQQHEQQADFLGSYSVGAALVQRQQQEHELAEHEQE